MKGKDPVSVISEGAILWEPSQAVKQAANLTRYMEWLGKERGLSFQSYQELWDWSVTELAQFWGSLWDYFDVLASKGYSSVLVERKLPGAQWFVGAELNYAEHIFRNMTDQRPAMIYRSEDEPLKELTWRELYGQTAFVARWLREQGVVRGDRVVAYMPNIPETIVAFLACASLGAIWSSCSPDFGSPSVLDRFQQIEPKILIAVDGYRWNGNIFDRREVVAELQASLPTLEKTLLVTLVSDGSSAKDHKSTELWDQVFETNAPPPELEYEQVPFNHPLWVLYSSGTTGLPKPIVQGQGGILLEHLKALVFHTDIKPGDRFFWFTSTGWMMWNFTVGALLAGTTIILYDGSPAYPDMYALWALAEETGMTYFGTSAAYISACRKAGLEPGRQFDLSRLWAVGSTGSPLAVDGFEWVYEHIHKNLSLESFSGGTDLCTPFLGGCRLLPVRAGEIQCRYLGAKVEAFDEDGNSLIDQVGELVIMEPMPSMPLFFWNDTDNRRYKSSYFEMYPGIWRHGDWIKIKPHGGSVIFGRSDATIKRHGVRMGTSEIYQVVEGMPEIIESLVVDLEALGRASYMALFVVLKEGVVLDQALVNRIKGEIRRDISPRHVPNEIYAVEEIPRTLSGKKVEVPVRKILLGIPPEQAANLDALRNPETIQFYVDLAQKIQNRSEDS
jgi:acetoacetyl-CoA synthetase